MMADLHDAEDAVALSIHRELLPQMSLIAPGVVGHTIQRGGLLLIPFIYAVREGSGDVGRYLDNLPTDHHIIVPNVISSRLAGMLQRRGFSPREQRGLDMVDDWERFPQESNQ